MLPGTLYGSIMDQTGKGLDGAQVKARAGGLTVNITPLSGGFYFSQVPGGTYTIECERSGYVTQGFEGVIVPALGMVVQNFIMTK